MVGPTRQEIDEPTDYTRLKLGFIALIAFSGGLTAVYGGGSLGAIAMALVAAAVLGAVLIQYVFWMLT
jgi:hypothetical protein